MMSFLRWVVGTLLVLLISNCGGPELDPVWNAPTDGGWRWSDSLSFSQEVDGDSLDLTVLLALTDAYDYSNIWLRLTARNEAGLDTTLRATQTFISPLGEWTVNPDGELYRVRFNGFRSIRLPRGTYQFTLHQDMADAEELRGVQRVGIVRD